MNDESDFGVGCGEWGHSSRPEHTCWEQLADGGSRLKWVLRWVASKGEKRGSTPGVALTCYLLPSVSFPKPYVIGAIIILPILQRRKIRV